MSASAYVELEIVVVEPVRFVANGTAVNGLGLQPEQLCEEFPEPGLDPCRNAHPAITSASGALAAGRHRIFAQANVGFNCCTNGTDSGGFSLSVSFTPGHRPVLIIPGIGATYAADATDDLFWLTHRGVRPGELQIDPLSRAYHDLIETFKRAGYQEFRDLFVVNYDWRLPPGPDDGQIDGRISGITAPSISGGQFLYGVDYLGDTLREVADLWTTLHPGGPPLDAVDVVAHSTGGLVARTYLQSAAYGGEYAPGRRLPRIENLIMVGVPNRGASKAWNPLHDNWVVDPSFQIVLSKIINRAYQKVLRNQVIAGPDYDITLASLQAPQCLDTQAICFINQYVPTARALLATYDFIDFGLGLTNVNEFPALRNAFALDLNAGLDGAIAVGDPNAFADLSTVTVIYGTNGGEGGLTPVQTTEALGPTFTLLGSRPIATFEDFLGRNARPNETFYVDVVAPDSGDGTVPLESSIGQFLFDPRVSLQPFTTGVNTAGSVGHTELMSNVDVQRAILATLGVTVNDPSDISTGLAGPTTEVVCAVSGCLNVIFDPVEGFVADAQGRRLGFTTATGPLTEIPGSVWFGNADGIGWVFGAVEGPLTLHLSGLGEDYYVNVSLMSPTAVGGVVDAGFLALGAQRVVPVPVAPPTSGVDGVAPSTTAVASPQANAAGWHGGPVVVTLDATDNVGGSGVRSITFNSTGAQPAAGTLAAASGAIDVTAEGTTTITAFATDNAGNAGPSRSLVVNIDKTAPLLDAARAPLANANGWNNTAVVVSVQCSDALSGLAPGSPPASVVVSAEGAGQAAGATCTDRAGNVATTTVTGVSIDLTPPSLTIPVGQSVPQTSPAGATVTYAAPIAADAGSGIAAASCLPASGSVFPVGSTTVRCSATDRAGNAATAAFIVTVTATSPSVPEGRMFGGGHIDAEGRHHHFLFRASRVRGREIGRLEYWVNEPRACRSDDHDDQGRGDHDDDYRGDRHGPPTRFEATSLSLIVFSDDPLLQPARRTPPTVDTVRFTGSGKWNGRSGYAFEASATDVGEPGRGRDTFSLVVTDPRGTVVARVTGTLDGGNIQSIGVGR
ncbi:MAG: HYR domain-containing protein [Vicinamibacteraceae bacterium]